MATLPDPNSYTKVKFRENILQCEREMKQMAAAGHFSANMDEVFPLKHYFAPIDPKYGCGAYAREIFIPKGHVIIGKIHRHEHLTFLLKGKISISTESGKQYLEAPCTFVSEAGVKRAAYAEEDTIWTTVHLTRHLGEDNLDKIEDEVIAPTYQEMGLIADTKELEEQ
jgi:quercetin dioxygenase-like cupin family protein